MADQAINTLPKKTTVTDTDALLMIGTSEEYQIDYGELADAILNKITSKAFTLNQGSKTLVAALNELNSKTSCFEYSNNILNLTEFANNRTKAGLHPFTLSVGTDASQLPLEETGWIYSYGFVLARGNGSNMKDGTIILFKLGGGLATRACKNGSWNDWKILH